MITEIERKKIIKSILNVRCREGSTIADIKDDYEEMTGEPLLDAHTSLSSIDSVYCDVYSNGSPKWYVESDNIKHITKMILEQRPAQQHQNQYQHHHQFQRQQQQQHSQQRQPKPQHVLNDSISSNDCFFQDNVIYKAKLRKMNSKYQQLLEMEDVNNNNDNNNNVSCYNLNLNVTIPSPSPPPQPKKRPPINLHAQLVGDDLFRTLVTRDTIDHMFNRNNGIQHIGFCVSGQTIASAAKQIELAHYFKATHLILNVGSVDILNGQTLDDMYTDFDHLIRVCEQRECIPIVTTLAPLANSSSYHSLEMHDKLNAFNFHLLNKYSINYPFIDVWQQFAMRNGCTHGDFYETDLMYVNGCSQPLTMWSHASRLMIRSHIIKQLHSILKISKMDRINFGA